MKVIKSVSLDDVVIDFIDKHKDDRTFSSFLNYIVLLYMKKWEKTQKKE